MQASTAPNLVAAARPALRISTRSVWSDQVWHLDGRRPGGHRSDFSLDWGFALADDSRFSDLRWTDWREAAKLFLWSLKLDPPPGRRNVHESTIVSAFKTLRKLIRWMAAQGYRSFTDLDRDGCDRFMAAMAQRPGQRIGQAVEEHDAANLCQSTDAPVSPGSEVPGSGDRRSLPGDRAALHSA